MNGEQHAREVPGRHVGALQPTELFFGIQICASGSYYWVRLPAGPQKDWRTEGLKEWKIEGMREWRNEEMMKNTLERCKKCTNFVDFGNCCRKKIRLHTSVSIKPRTSLPKSSRNEPSKIEKGQLEKPLERRADRCGTPRRSCSFDRWRRGSPRWCSAARCRPPGADARQFRRLRTAHMQGIRVRLMVAVCMRPWRRIINSLSVPPKK